MADKLQEEAAGRWKGLSQPMIKAIGEAVNRRVKVAQMAQGIEEPAELPLGLVEIVAEETIKYIPALLLWHWGNSILTPEDIKRHRQR